jgi:hypothetical protein
MEFGISVPNCVEGMAFPIPFAGHSDVNAEPQPAI